MIPTYLHLQTPSAKARFVLKIDSRRHQQGFLSQRTWAILAILIVLLLIPFWWAKHVNNKTAAEVARVKGTAAASLDAGAASAMALEKAVAGNSTVVGPDGVERTAPAIVAAAEAQTQARAAAANPDRHGLSFGHLPDADGLMVSGCSGLPMDMARPDKGQCNPYAGDTSCRTALPILCISEAGGGEATPASLGGTAPVAGFVLGSVSQANARCSTELGAGWRMAEFHDGGGWNISGKRGRGLDNTNLRHWLHINNQKSNCWDAEAK